MDRFIGQGSGITSDIITDLKSNMDRFIDDTATEVNINAMYLKSNMDRFIDKVQLVDICKKEI